MNRDDLDAFFAKAEDVLTDWHGGKDAMHARVPESDDVEALPGESYYDQQMPLTSAHLAAMSAAGRQMGRSLARFGESMAQVGTNLAELHQRHEQRGAEMQREMQRLVERVLTPRPGPAGGVVEYQVADVPLRWLPPDLGAFVVNYPGVAAIITSVE